MSKTPSDAAMKANRGRRLRGDEVLDEKFAASFWAKVDKRGQDECWPWMRRCRTGGHGALHVRRSDGTYVSTSASRVVWVLTHGPISPGLVVCHHCDNPPCCNPKHMFSGTIGDNNRDAFNKGRNKNYVPPSRFTDEQLRDAVGRVRAGETQAAVARSIGASLSYFNGVIKGRKMRHIAATP